MTERYSKETFAQELIGLIYDDQMQPAYDVHHIVTVLISTAAAMIVTSAVEPTKVAKQTADALLFQVWQAQEVLNKNPTSH